MTLSSEPRLTGTEDVIEMPDIRARTVWVVGRKYIFPNPEDVLEEGRKKLVLLQPVDFQEGASVFQAYTSLSSLLFNFQDELENAEDHYQEALKAQSNNPDESAQRMQLADRCERRAQGMLENIRKEVQGIIRLRRIIAAKIEKGA